MVNLKYLGLFGNEFENSWEEILQHLQEKFPGLESLFLKGNMPCIDSEDEETRGMLIIRLPKLQTLDNKLLNL